MAEQAVLFQQLCGRAHLRHAAAGEQDDLIGVHDGTHAVRDDEHRLIPDKPDVYKRQEHPDVRPETAGFLTLLREQTERLTQMTKTLLEMSNLQQVARNEQLQLAPMVEEIFTDLAPLAEKRSISLEAEGDASLTGSDALIYRLLFNLTENAVKYNRSGGAVRVELTQRQEKCIIRVSDTGCGIPEEYQRSIFHPF